MREVNSLEGLCRDLIASVHKEKDTAQTLGDSVDQRARHVLQKYSPA